MSAERFLISGDTGRKVHRKEGCPWPEGYVAFGERTGPDQIFVEVLAPPPAERVKQIHETMRRGGGMVLLGKMALAREYKVAAGGAVSADQPIYTEIAQSEHGQESDKGMA
ncbi:MAG: hypothetical protein ABIG34_05490 [Candidatus Peregrinibacteria bacterium]